MLAACGPAGIDEPEPGDTDGIDPQDEEAALEGEQPDDAAPDGDGREDEALDPSDTDPSDTHPSDTEPLAGDPSTETVDRDAEFGMMGVTEVRVATHDGFDRIVLELEGEGVAGWHVGYVDRPRSQGSGEDVDVAGEAFLSIAIHGVALPPDLPDDIELWGGSPLAGPAGGVVVELVDDTIFEGTHLLFAGVDAELPFLVDRFEDPQRVVVDVFHPR